MALKMCGVVCYRDNDGMFNGNKRQIRKEVKTDVNGLTKAERDAVTVAVSHTLIAAFERYNNNLKRSK